MPPKVILTVTDQMQTQVNINSAQTIPEAIFSSIFDDILHQNQCNNKDSMTDILNYSINALNHNFHILQDHIFNSTPINNIDKGRLI